MLKTSYDQEKLPLIALLALSFISFSIIVTELLPAGVLLQMSVDLSVSESHIGMLVSVYAIASAIVAIPGIALTRKFPRKKLLLTLLAGFALVNAVTALSTNYTLIIVARVLAGILAGILWPLVGGYASRLVPSKNMGLAVAIALTGSTIALAIGIPLATALVELIGWRMLFIGLSLLSVFLFVWVLLKLPSFPGEDSRNQVPVIKVLSIPGMPLILMATFTTLLAHYVLYTYIAPYIETVQFEGGTSLALLLFGMGTLLGIGLTGKFIDTHFRSLALGTVLLTAISMLIIGMFGDFPVISHLSMFLWGTSFGGAPTLFQTASHRVSGSSKDIATSMIVTVYNTGIFGGSMIGGMILGISHFVLPWTSFILIIISFFIILKGNHYAFPKKPTKK